MALSAEEEEALELAWGAPGSDESVAIESMSLEDLLADIPSLGGVGSFGVDLKDSPYDIYVHGYATFDWYKKREAPNTFDMHYFNILVGAELGENITTELQLEHEHGDEISIRYAQVDLRLREDLYLRAGIFLVPFGVYNEFLYPEFLSKLPRNPLVSAYRHIVPTAWNDTGIQLFGEQALRSTGLLQWNVYATNGLRQIDDPETPHIDDGGAIREMRGNTRDKASGGKALGARVTLSPVKVFNIGASAYSGAYTEDDSQRITFLGAHTGLEFERFTFRTEGAYVLQGSSLGTLKKLALYSRASFKVKKWLEPATGLDISIADPSAGMKIGLLGSINLYPYHKHQANAVLRLAGGRYMGTEDAMDSDIIMAQLTLGF